jgi:ubiquinone biosynthesis protein Coq4
MKTSNFQKIVNVAYDIHLKTSSFVAKLIGPMVFDFGSKDKNWNLTTADLLQYSEGSLGKAMGQFLNDNKVEPLAHAEYHDVHHVLFDYSITFKDEVALQFFLRGNGKRSLASFGTSIGAWILLPTQWNYLKNSYRRGQNCIDISQLNLKELLNEDLQKIKSTLYKTNSYEN